MGDARLDYDALDVRLVRSFPEGRETTDVLEKHAEGPLLHDGLEQVADVGHVAAGGRAAADVLSWRAAGKRTP